jgi:hypothetical protein
MSDPSSEHENLKALWQGLPQESDPMSLEHIQAISRRLDRNEQRSGLVMLAVAALGFFMLGLVWQNAPDLMMRVTYALNGLGMAGCFAITYRMGRLKRDPTEPGGVFLRRRLEHFLRLSGGRSFVAALPLIPGIVALIVVGFIGHEHAPPRPHLTGLQVALNFLPIVLLAAIWLAVLLYYAPRSVRRLRCDLDELNAAMK